MIDHERSIGILQRLRATTRRVLFGDRIGLAIFLASLCLFGLVWRTSFLISDSYTLANGLYALERGSVDMTTAAYGPSLDTPGATFHDGGTYSRNYGVLVVALPFLVAVRAVSAVADLRIVLVAIWSLLVLATVLVTGRIFGRQRYARIGGSVAVLLLFGGNVALARPLDPPQFHLLALQAVHMCAAALVGVFTYRLVTELHDRRIGVVAAVLVTLGTPLAFWAAVPKRHVVTAAVVVAVAFAITRSRSGDRPYSTTARALAYALVGFLAWVHAPEALVLLLALVIVDVPTAPANDRRTIAIVGATFLLSLLPMFATNIAITGNPVKVPRTLSSVGSGADVSLADSGGGEGGGSSGGGSSRLLPEFVLVAFSLLDRGLKPLRVLVTLMSEGVTTMLKRPDEVYYTFVRNGHLSGYARRVSRSPAANLSLLESAPLVAGIVGLAPGVLVARHRFRNPIRFVRELPAADAFVVLLAVGYSLLYVSRLPLHAQVTVRYLFPLYPLAVYGLIRIRPIRVSLIDHWRTFLWSYASALSIGGQLLFVVLVFLAPGRGEAFQFHGLLALATAGLVGIWALSGRTDGWCGRAGAAAMALTTAATTMFTLFVSLEYYALGDSHALPMMRALGEIITII